MVPGPSAHMKSMSENDGFKRNERVVHPVKGAGTIYQNQNGFVNAMVEFDDHRNVVIGVPADELKRSQTA